MDDPHVIESVHDLVILGGGPAGTTAAALAARDGLDVLLLEAAQHPRPHVGESLLPGIIPILSEMDALAAIEAAGFQRKTGGTYWGWGTTPRWDLWFADTEVYDHAWLVDRSRFDALLFDAARRSGATCRENAVARELRFDDDDRLTAVEWIRRGEAELRVARAPLFVDATGQAALIGKARGLRAHIDGLKHQALYGTFEHAGRLPPPRQDQAFFVGGEDHWTWLFPIDAQRTSVGVVHLDRPDDRDFETLVRSDADIDRVLGPDARLVGTVQRERDWSYRMNEVTGPGWLLAGDASGFVDPILSTGVFLAMNGGRNAARAAVSIHRGDDEQATRDRFARQQQGLLDDMVRMVRFFYQQNLHHEDYFWESKRILLSSRSADLRPQKAFLILTSGLVGNLAFDSAKLRATRRREAMTSSGEVVDESVTVPDDLGFVCIHLRFRSGDDSSSALYFLIEPSDPAAPTLFRTRNLHLNCLAPRYGNDPIQEPELEGPLRSLHRTIDRLDTEPGEPLSAFWARTRREISAAVDALPDTFDVVRVFGE